MATRRSLASSLHQSTPSQPSRQSLGQSLGLGSATTGYRPTGAMNRPRTRSPLLSSLQGGQQTAQPPVRQSLMQSLQGQTINADDGGTPTGIRTVANNTGQGASFQPKAGVIPGPFRSEVTLSPSGRLDNQGNPIQKATVQGNLPESRLKELGVVDGDRTAMYARQGANAQRIRNKVMARTLGLNTDIPTDPVLPGASMGDIQASLQTQGQTRDFLGERMQDRRVAQGAARGNPFLSALQGDSQPTQDQPEPATNNAPDDGTRWRNQYNSVYGSLIAREGTTPEQADQEARRIADMMYPGSSGGGSNTLPQGQSTVPVQTGLNSQAWINQNLPTQVQEQLKGAGTLEDVYRVLTRNGYQPGSQEWQKAKEAFLAGLDPSEQRRQTDLMTLPAPGSGPAAPRIGGQLPTYSPPTRPRTWVDPGVGDFPPI